MSLEVKRTKAFENSAKKVFKLYPLSQKALNKAIDDLPITHLLGDIYPAIVPQVRKLRLPLKEYRIGKSGGARIIYASGKRFILPVMLYYKGQYGQEVSVKKAIIEQLRNVLLEHKESCEAH